MRRVWLSTAMLATGVALMAAAQLADAAPERRGGVFKYGTTGASVQIDPQLAYITTAWWLEYATAAKLYNYTPKGALVPEVASRYKVSNGGRRYTFFIRKGFRFSDGERVNARHFKYAINRAANEALASPGVQFITDPNATEIVGAKAVNDGRANDVRGVQARGNRLIIDLVRANPGFLSTIAMPFFQATSTKLPLDREVASVSRMSDLPSAGPYAFALNDVNSKTSLRRNPFWKRGPARKAQRNLAGLDLIWNLNEQAAFEMVERRELDEGPLPAAEVESVARQYGVNKTRYWVQAQPCFGWIAFNNSRGLFQGNLEMRKAVNWALDRTAFGGRPWTHLLPPGFPGSITKKSLQPYSPGPNIVKARELAAGHFRDGRITMYYRSSGTINPAQAERVKRNLIDLGFDPANITMKGFIGGNIYTAIALRGSDWDIAVSLGHCTDFPDPAGFVSLALSGPPFSPDSPTYRAKLTAALRLSGPARFRALGKLDISLMKNVAPFAVTNTYDDRHFFSNRVDPRSVSFHGVYTGWNIRAMALK